MFPIININTNQIVGATSNRPPFYTGEEIPVGFDIREDEIEAAFYIDGQFIRKGTFILEDYKTKKLNLVSIQCYQEMYKILPQAKQLNILFGATDGYPDYLKGELGKKNLANLIEKYKYISHKCELALSSSDCDTKEKIDLILASIHYPTLEEIMQEIITV